MLSFAAGRIEQKLPHVTGARECRAIGCPRVILLLLLLMMLPSLAGGCAWRSGPDPSRRALAAPPPLPAEDWPVRSVEALLANRGSDDDRSGTAAVTADADGAAATAAASEHLFGAGVVRVIGEATAETPLAFTVETAGPAEDHLALEAVMRALPLEAPPIETPAFERISTHCLLFPATNAPAKGLVVHLISLMQLSPYEAAVTRELRERGWAVLEIGHPTLLWEERLFALARGGDPISVGQSFAREVDRLLAEWAYAVEAARAYLAAEHPEVPQDPCVLLGFSLGAIALPAVAARDPSAVDAAVIVVGGADLSDILPQRGHDRRSEHVRPAPDAHQRPDGAGAAALSRGLPRDQPARSFSLGRLPPGRAGAAAARDV